MTAKVTVATVSVTAELGRSTVLLVDNDYGDDGSATMVHVEVRREGQSTTLVSVPREALYALGDAVHALGAARGRR